jgi:hypothetical protein
MPRYRSCIVTHVAAGYAARLYSSRPRPCFAPRASTAAETLQQQSEHSSASRAARSTQSALLHPPHTVPAADSARPPVALGLRAAPRARARTLKRARLSRELLVALDVVAVDELVVLGEGPQAVLAHLLRLRARSHIAATSLPRRHAKQGAAGRKHARQSRVEQIPAMLAGRVCVCAWHASRRVHERTDTNLVRVRAHFLHGRQQLELGELGLLLQAAVVALLLQLLQRLAQQRPSAAPGSTGRPRG